MEEEAGTQEDSRDALVVLRAIAFVEGTSRSDVESLASTLMHEGARIVQTTDHVVVASFESARLAVRGLRTLVTRARAGASCGDVVAEGGLLHGLPVIQASRLMEAAPAGEVWCTERLLDLADISRDEETALGEVALKGLAPVPIFRLRGSGARRAR